MFLLIIITEAAASRIQEMKEAEESKGELYLRVGVKGGGCSGLTYGMGFDSEVKEEDTTFEQNGINVVVDQESSKILEGVVIDFKQSMMGGGFTIENPNAIANCGCGTSFRTAENAGTPEEC
ncbi:iron-sulfur cluster assembly accessory protein [Lottiidibacillus patelloidae]|uniref:Iron-sulfur cluster assembly accessory protein n=1 Tax=Lottiidibacillus patelloidae TaxID=2670334 RepID=A0A263BRA3_9BACI|nr:iron-sulfur cluster assembly accessory protein [Lottiidibacillus patelloidae]OZM55756.1 iron-sulfur cluster assembly accessory protein [Lottiidibacillus patelloidae]